MKPRTFLGSALALSLSSLSLLLSAGSGGCGQDVATCGTVCSLADAPSGCASSCGSAESACGATGYGGAFQALLTCIGNAGSYATANTACASQSDEVTTACDAPSGTSPGSSGGSGTGTGPIVGSSFECEQLSACCEQLSSSTQGSCTEVVEAGNGATCEDLLQNLESSGDCGGSGGAPDAGTIVFDSSIGTFDASVPSGGCALGGACSDDGSTCTNVNAGPCGSDQQLQCSSGVFVADGFPCDGNVGSCAFGSGTCSESCTCSGGQMICQGDCPDAGASSP